MRPNFKAFALWIGFASLTACTSTTINNSITVDTFDVKSLKIGDSVDKYNAMAKSDVYDLIVTFDPKTKKIVRIKYIQKRLLNNEKNQKYLVNYVCNKYGWVTPCSSALAEIESDKKQFLRFSHLYRDDAETQELSVRIRRTKTFSLNPDLTVEIDLMDSAYAKALREQKATASDLIDF